MSSHTKGPWEMEGPYKLRESPAVWQIWNKFSTYWIAWVQRADYMPQECEANARLIAAAPELLEALKGFVEEWDELCMNQLSPAYIAATAAIAKAGGL